MSPSSKLYMIIVLDPICTYKSAIAFSNCSKLALGSFRQESAELHATLAPVTRSHWQTGLRHGQLHCWQYVASARPLQDYHSCFAAYVHELGPWLQVYKEQAATGTVRLQPQAMEPL